MLGEMDRARAHAGQVLQRLNEAKERRGGKVSDDYWERVTEPEARLLLGDDDDCVRLYHEARIANLAAVGSIRSTAAQIELLLRLVPGIPQPVAAALRQEFAAYWPGT